MPRLAAAELRGKTLRERAAAPDLVPAGDNLYPATIGGASVTGVGVAGAGVTGIDVTGAGDVNGVGAGMVDLTGPLPGANALGEGFGWVLVELAPDGIVVVDQGGTIVLANRRVEDLFGYARDALVGRRVEQLMPRRFRGAHLGHRHTYEADPGVRPMGTGREIWGCHADGTDFPVDVSLSPVMSGTGQRTVAVIRDGSRLHAAEQAARELLALQDAVANAVRLSDSAAQQIHLATLRLTGLMGTADGAEADAISRSLGDLQSALDHILHAAFSMKDPPTQM